MKRFSRSIQNHPPTDFQHLFNDFHKFVGICQGIGIQFRKLRHGAGPKRGCQSFPLFLLLLVLQLLLLQRVAVRLVEVEVVEGFDTLFGPAPCPTLIEIINKHTIEFMISTSVRRGAGLKRGCQSPPLLLLLLILRLLLLQRVAVRLIEVEVVEGFDTPFLGQHLAEHLAKKSTQLFCCQ